MDRENRILIIDDNASQCKTLQAAIEKEDYLISISHSISDSLQMLYERPYHVALINNRFLVSHGVDLVGSLHKIQPGLAVILLADQSTIDTAIKALYKGATAYVLKPLKIDELLITIRREIDNQILVHQERRLTQLLLALNQVARMMATESNLEKTLQAIVDMARELVGASYAALNLFQEEGRVAYYVISGEFDEENKINKPLNGHPNWDYGLEELTSIRLPDVQRHPTTLDFILDHPKVNSMLFVPIVFRGRELGNIYLINKISPDILIRNGKADEENAIYQPRYDQFTEMDQQEIETLASQAAAVIENAQLFAAEHQRVLELESLQFTGLQLTSSLDLSTVLVGIVESALSLVDASNCHIFLYDESSQNFTSVVALWFDGRKEPAVKIPRPNGLTATVAREARPIIVNDAPNHPLYSSPEASEWQIKAIAGFPLKRDDRVVGVFTVTFIEAHTFKTSELRVLNLLADQAAIAIHNASSYKTEQQRRRELAILNRAGQELNATHEPLVVLEIFLEEIRQLLGASGCAVWLVDTKTKEIVPYPKDEVKNTNGQNLWLLPGQQFARQVIQTGKSIYIPDVLADRKVEKPNNISQDWVIRSFIGVPLRGKHEIIGVIQVFGQMVSWFKVGDLNFVESLAATAAVAIENTRLYEQARKNAETKAILLNEVNHRVKNNLASIAGLLYAEMRHAGIEDKEKYQTIIKDLINRVQGLSAVHNMLSASEWAPLRLSELAGQVIRNSLQTLPFDKEVFVNVSPSSIHVVAKQANSLALLLSELTTNSVKYAFAGRMNTNINVQISHNENLIQIEYRDDGPGYPEDVLTGAKYNVGLHLVKAIIQEDLHGELALENHQGAVTNIRFNLAE